MIIILSSEVLIPVFNTTDSLFFTSTLIYKILELMYINKTNEDTIKTYILNTTLNAKSLSVSQPVFYKKKKSKVDLWKIVL